MFKFSSIVLILFVIDNGVLTQLCSVAKVNNSCVCKRTRDPEDNFGVTIADCSQIQLKHFPDPAQLTNDLNVLDLSHNIIKILDNVFSGDTLKTLDLSYNYINSISSGFFYKMPNLQKLILSHNNIDSLNNEDFFKFNQKLTHLDLSFNNIKILESNILLPLKILQSLDLSYNDLTLGDSLTQSADFLSAKLGLTTNISRLKMDNIGLEDIHNVYFNKYINLKFLSLADNHFENIPSIPYSVEYLDLSGSNIAVLQAKHLSYHSLKVFKLDRMKKLESIHPYAFYNLQALEELSITDCWQLKEFNDLVFGLPTKNIKLPLKKISLSKNSLKTLNYTYKYLFENLDYIDISNNPWTCDCNLLWLQEIDNFYNNKSIKCSSPAYLSGKLVSDLSREDLSSCYPEKYGKRFNRIIIPVLILLVIILFGLVGSLIYYAPNWYDKRSRRIGPQSPYNPTRTEENAIL